jgi:hypothetical protein
LAGLSPKITGAGTLVNRLKIYVVSLISAIFLVMCYPITPSSTNIPQTFGNTPPIATVEQSASPTIEISPSVFPATLGALATLNAIITKEPDIGEYRSLDCITFDYPCEIDPALSPDGNWAVFYYPEYYGGLSVVNVNNTERWDINYFDIASCPCGDSAGVYVEHWSKDGKYFYVSPHDGSEGGLEDFWQSKKELWRLDLESGDIINTQMGPAFSFSPDDSSIVYRNGQEIVVHEFQTGLSVEFNVPHKYKSFGRFVWSPDKENIAFIVSDDLSFSFSLLILNLENMNTRFVLVEDERSLYPAAWPTTEILLLQRLFDVGYGYADMRDGGYQLNLRTNEITKWISP